ncbi:hypothetical protein C798_06135 [Herbaspirillum rubrisubalbicans Os34]|uniref:Transposase n=2 Tax=Herbaspirillum TaxID=963 RepID=A0A6M3ZQV6_9BURK|nr:hypothetical protein [Herbaspirillum rubrisubalbicans]QJP99821.1 hypothetical protein C798_06135 [Herbaspirillum rubrisubalbicans Os34]
MSMKVHTDFYVRAASSGLPAGFYRVVWMTDREPDLVLVEIPTYEDVEHQAKLKIHYKRPLIANKKVIEKGILNGNVLLAEASPELRKKEPVLNAVLSPKEKLRAAILKDFDMQATHTLIFGKRWEAEMTRLSKKYGGCTNTIKRLILKYFYTGRNLEETVRDKRRPKGLPRVIKKKLGRKRDIVKTGRSTEEGVNREEHEGLVISYLASRGKDASNSSIPRMYEDFYATFAVEKVMSSDGKAIGAERIPPEKRMTLAQFRTIVKAHDLNAYLLRSYSKHRGRLITDVHISDARYMTTFAGNTYIIDSTIADVYLVSSYDRNKILGRPVIYLVIDARTSLLLSVYVTLWGPSFAEARNALFLAYSDKKAYLRYLRLEHFQDFFRAGPRPLDVLADRAELLSENGKNLARKHENGLMITAAYQPVWKALVERSFKRLNEMVIHYLPGTVPPEHARGDADYRYEAVFTLWEFRRLMALEQIRWNASKAMGKCLSPQMLRAGVEATPLSIWDWSLANEHGSASYYEHNQLLITSLDAEYVSVTTEGLVSKNKLKWTAEWMKDHDGVKRAKIQRCEAILIQSPEDPSLAYCRMQGEETFREVHLRNAPRSAYPITKEDVEDLNAEKRFSDDMAAFKNTGLIDEVKALQVELEGSAKAATYSCVSEKSTSKAARKKDIHKTRAAEAEYEKTGQAPDGDGAHAVDTPAVNAGVGDAVATSDEKAEKHDVNHDVADVLETW